MVEDNLIDNQNPRPDDPAINGWEADDNEGNQPGHADRLQDAPVDAARVEAEGRLTGGDDCAQANDRQITGKKMTVGFEGSITFQPMTEGQTIGQANGEDEERGDQVNNRQADIGSVF